MASIIAISKGAKIIEKHITIDNKLPGPDHKSSLNLKNFKVFLDKIKEANIILGNNKKFYKERKSKCLRFQERVFILRLT